MNNNITFVTALLDLKRSQLKSNDFKRTFSQYIETFTKLLAHLKDKRLVVYTDTNTADLIKSIKSEYLVIKIISTEDLKNSEYYDKIQQIRNNEEWRNQVGWLSESTQANLEYYNPMIFNKIHWLEEVSQENYFDTDYFAWIDAGIANAQCHPGYFSKDWFEERLAKYLNNKMLFICFPYEHGDEIHGFKRDAMNCYSKTDNVNRVARATFFGGSKNEISFFSNEFRRLSHETLDSGYMGTEESIYTILTYLYPDQCNIEMIPSHGLVFDFFEKVQRQEYLSNTLGGDRYKSDLYIITFNSPKQFLSTVEHIEKNCPDILNFSDKYVINNSTDKLCYNQYQEIFKRYKFTEFKKDNIGICGGRQFVAEHFDTTKNPYMLFFEDDMMMNGPETISEKCKNGFRKYEPDLYIKLIHIMNSENYDFIKWNFTEFFGDNKTQWAWYNVPQTFREKHWPDNPILPEQGFHKNPPLCKFTNIKSYKGLGYIEGEIYYCNWPQIVSKKGNSKMFLETKWEHPYEQTWMSDIYQKTIKGYVNPALLLLSPVTHNRFDHYETGSRREH
jgi:hypothetical protein